MKEENIPELSKENIEAFLLRAANSPRRRHPKILHDTGAELNKVFNFMMQDTYMQPHLHEDKVENIYLIRGSLVVLFFDDKGKIEKTSLLSKHRKESIEIPALNWHTYIMLSKNVVTYETMLGKYDPKTWKQPAEWAPSENLSEYKAYLSFLREACTKYLI
jgi:cupin fold WbuC family metalloprotein